MNNNKNSFFFPFSLEEEDNEPLEEKNEDGYGQLTNDWYDMPGQHYVYFEKNSKYRKESC